jgi:hypothetical protein
MAELWAELAAHASELALIFATTALASVGVVLALFLRPKLKEFDELKESHTKLKTEYGTLQIPKNLADVQKLTTDVAVLQQSEFQRNERLNAGIESLNKLTKQMAHEIKVTIAAGDQENLERLLTWRVDQLETSYTLSKIQGGTQEEEARDEWNRAKDELARFLDKKQKQRSTGVGN